MINAKAIFLAFYIIPNMSKLVSVDKWPPLSYNLYLLANTVTQNSTLILIVSASLITFVSWSLANLPAYGLRSLLDKLPPWNIYKAYTATSFLIALSSSIKLGSSFNSAILQLQPISSPYLKTTPLLTYKPAIKLTTATRFKKSQLNKWFFMIKKMEPI